MEKKIAILENKIDDIYSKILNGDRTILQQNEIFGRESFNNYTENELYAVRKHIKSKVLKLNIELDNIKLEDKKGCLLKLALYDQLKYEIKQYMSKFEKQI